MAKLRVFVKSGCSWCVDATAWLRARNFSFEEINVSRDPEAFAEMRRISGQSLAPTLEVGGLVLPDFDTRQLEIFLRENEIAP